MPLIEVLVAEMPSMLEDIVRDAVATQADMQLLLERTIDGATAPDTVSRVVVVGTREPDETGLPARILKQPMGTMVLAIALNGERATLWRLKLEKRQLADVSPESLIAAVRAATQSA